MDRDYFITTERTGFSHWRETDTQLAQLLWGDAAVTKFICASGTFSPNDICSRLKTEMENEKQHQIQYWPVFHLKSGEFIGCCGLRPHGENRFETGFHLRPKFWGQGYATEVAQAVVQYAFNVLQAEGLFAGHNPNNTSSKKVLTKLGFEYTGDEFYPPTGLYHPSYILKKDASIHR